MANRKSDEPAQPPAHEEVSHPGPPTRRRFKESGNPKGRPKGAKNRKTIVKAVADEMHSAIESGKRRRLSTLDLVLLRLRNMAMVEKNPRAFEELHRLIKTYQPQEANSNLGYIVVPAAMTPEEFMAEAEKQNAVSDARQEALSRK